VTLAGVFPELVAEDINPAVTNREKAWRGVSPVGTPPGAERLRFQLSLCGMRSGWTDLFLGLLALKTPCMCDEKTPTGIVCSNWRETSDSTVVPEIDAAVSDIPGTPASQLLTCSRGSTNSEAGSTFAELFIRKKKKKKKFSRDRIIRRFIGRHRVGVWTSVRCAVQSSSLLPRSDSVRSLSWALDHHAWRVLQYGV